MDNNLNKHTIKTFQFPHNWSERQYFIYACFVNDLQEFYKQWIEQGKKAGRIQFFDSVSDDNFIHKYWVPSKICCESGEVLTQDNIDIKVGYWTPNIWKPIRKDLLIEAKRFESFECQKIDSSCNDCKYLNRPNNSCLKFNKSIKIESNLCHPQNVDCFEHRKL